jgi:pyruvate-ferredoxin/flavodoxin oxidoreductase
MLEYLGGLHIDRMETSHREELEDWKQKYTQSNIARENAIDSIARGMAELASASGAPTTAIDRIPVNVASAAQTATRVPARVPGDQQEGPLVEITEEDMPRCTNCKTCYQDLAELFEKTKIVVDGTPREVSRVIPGVLDRIEITDELVQRAARVADDCDAEIIRFKQPA